MMPPTPSSGVFANTTAKSDSSAREIQVDQQDRQMPGRTRGHLAGIGVDYQVAARRQLVRDVMDDLPQNA